MDGMYIACCLCSKILTGHESEAVEKSHQIVPIATHRPRTAAAAMPPNNLPLSKGRSTRAEGARRERCSVTYAPRRLV